MTTGIISFVLLVLMAIVMYFVMKIYSVLRTIECDLHEAGIEVTGRKIAQTGVVHQQTPVWRVENTGRVPEEHDERKIQVSQFKKFVENSQSRKQVKQFIPLNFWPVLITKNSPFFFLILLAPLLASRFAAHARTTTKFEGKLTKEHPNTLNSICFLLLGCHGCKVNKTKEKTSIKFYLHTVNMGDTFIGALNSEFRCLRIEWTPTNICAIDAEKPFLKYVCIFLLYEHDCNKHSFKTVLKSNRMKYDAGFRKTFSFFLRISITWLPLQFPWCSFFSF